MVNAFWLVLVFVVEILVYTCETNENGLTSIDGYDHDLFCRLFRCAAIQHTLVQQTTVFQRYLFSFFLPITFGSFVF